MCFVAGISVESTVSTKHKSLEMTEISLVSDKDWQESIDLAIFLRGVPTESFQKALRLCL